MRILKTVSKWKIMGLVIKAYIKKILFTFFILIASAILGNSLLSLVYCLPTDKITQHVASGVQTFLTEGATFEYASGYKSRPFQVLCKR